MFTINNNIIEFYGNHARIFIACCKKLVHILHGMLSGIIIIIIIIIPSSHSLIQSHFCLSIEWSHFVDCLFFI